MILAQERRLSTSRKHTGRHADRGRPSYTTDVLITIRNTHREQNNMMNKTQMARQMMMCYTDVVEDYGLRCED